ncbi:hypothetical protein UK23_06225 [Lentzea aerocolonigenes]|uniref:Uncharacterized protein n=1 Tax=Lentzea aerocolonigenes TaxID=68170 RepID=A0A0F0HBI6_LENAE|nr:DUF6271 family protein [Lentzea aerocolonigenes]KJK51702.1 hypothetical protein UK23_06225 [Lentzea aerocolonigenes]
MRRICLTLPTNRPCADTLTAVAQEASWAAGHFGVEVVLLVLDSSSRVSFARHAAVLAGSPRSGATVLHLDEDDQRAFLRQVVDGAGVLKPDLLLDLMLPAGVSYGACTNRAFLLAAALGCESVHRRDSDFRYQIHDGTKVFPVLHELTSLGWRARDVIGSVTETDLDPAHLDRPVVLAGGSFIGELSVDIGEIAALDKEVYYDVVGLWAPAGWSREEKRKLADDSFAGAGDEPFTGDHSVLSVVDPMHVDMCNIAFYQVHEQMPLSPATDTIGSDYFLHHLVRSAGLPGVLHNRHIVNYHTAERKTGAGFDAYHLRLTKFFLSMLYLHFVYDRMAELGDSLLDSRFHVRTPVVAELIRNSTELAEDENAERLDVLGRSYRKLGGRYAAFAATLPERGPLLLAEAERDAADFALLAEDWAALVSRSKATPLRQNR